MIRNKTLLLVGGFLLVALLIIFPLTHTIHTRWLWYTHSKDLKAQTLAQSPLVNDQLHHIQLDTWGTAGAGRTVVYLVYDPTNSLAGWEPRESKRVPGLPCIVADVHQLEPQWYTVTFSKDTDWEHC